MKINVVYVPSVTMWRKNNATDHKFIIVPF